MRRCSDGPRMYCSIMAQLGASFNGYAGPCETTGVGRECRHRCNPAKVKSHTNFTANSSEKPCKLATTVSGREKSSAAPVAGWCERGAKLFCARKAPRVRFVSPVFICANLTQAFEDAMATHSSLLGGLYNHTETNRENVWCFFLKARSFLSDCREYLSQSYRVDLNVCHCWQISPGGFRGAWSEEKHIQMFN